jgi:hypothetical protein
MGEIVRVPGLCPIYLVEKSMVVVILELSLSIAAGLSEVWYGW